MNQPHWPKYREQQLRSASGDILEIGVGTGLNLPHYPAHVRQITTVDPNPGMNRRLVRRIKETGIEVDQRVIGGESLPFASASFDCVVSTMTMCSIPGVEQALGEVFRVLKPGGELLFLEHGLSSDAGVAKRQRRWDWLQRRLADGCTLTLDVPALLKTQPFAEVECQTFYMEKTPKTHGYMFHGSARR